MGSERFIERMRVNLFSESAEIIASYRGELSRIACNHVAALAVLGSAKITRWKVPAFKC
jgi:hypothetical protein